MCVRNKSSNRFIMFLFLSRVGFIECSFYQTRVSVITCHMHFLLIDCFIKIQFYSGEFLSSFRFIEYFFLSSTGFIEYFFLSSTGFIEYLLLSIIFYIEYLFLRVFILSRAFSIIAQKRHAIKNVFRLFCSASEIINL